MINNLINYKYCFLTCCLLFSLAACKKSEQFYDQLKGLPQIDQRPEFAYKPAYITGDTMVITGLMKPLNTLLVNIGGTKANIISVDSVKYRYPSGGGVYGYDSTYLDRIKIVITQAMEGKSKEVKLTNNGHSLIGSTIDVFSIGGKGSFNDSLKLVAMKTFSNTGNIFLYGNNGKGDIYYYEQSSKSLRHINKDGSEEALFDFSILNDQFGNYTIGNFLTGGVNPQGTIAYLAVTTSSGDYKLLKLDIKAKILSTLNKSAAIGIPYEGNIQDVKIVIKGIYPDSKGNIYMTIGNNNVEQTPSAVAVYNDKNGQFAYIFRILDQNIEKFPGMPGVGLEMPATDQHIQGIRFSPEENLLYALTFVNTPGQGGVSVYDLSARVKLEQFQPNLPSGAVKPLDILGAFSSLGIFWDSTPDRCFGFLPMPGKRLQVMQYQFFGPFGANPSETAKNGLPKWTVLDFAEQRIYAYGLGRCNVGNNAFGPYSRYNGATVNITDQLLNYDEEGNLYMTANGKTALVKTQVIN
ncbi:MAG: hypothetical protein ABWZ25_08570 [Chitinophagaceae bacterium]